DAALEALADLGDVVLEPAQPGDLEALPDDRAVAQDPSATAAADLPVPDDRPGDVAELARPEDLADLRLTETDLLELRLEHALERRLDLFDGLVDHRVVPDLHALAVGDVGVLALGPEVEPDDDRVRRHGEVDVVQRDRADTPVDDPHVDLVAHVDLVQSILQRFDRTRRVTLEDEGEGVDLGLSVRVTLEDDVEGVTLAVGERLVEVLERDPLAGLGERGSPGGGLLALRD